MPLQVRLIVAEPARRNWLKNTLQHDPGFIVVSDNPNMDQGPYPDTDLFIVDLAYPQASLPRFWMVIHALYPWARLMAVTTVPMDRAALKAALHAGAYYMVTWDDPTERLRSVAHWAGYDCGYVPLGPVVEEIMALFSDLNRETPYGQGGTRDLELPKHEPTRENRHLILTPLEFNLLNYLLRNAGRVISTAELLQTVWPLALPHTRTKNRLKSMIKRLRRKIEPDPKHPRYLRTAHGNGYYLSPGIDWQWIVTDQPVGAITC